MKSKFDTKIINLFGGPGVGKSTLAARIYSDLSSLNKISELVTEIYKDEVWEDNQTALLCAPYLSGKQLFRQYRALSKVEYVVTDSPILLANVYSHAFNLPRFGVSSSFKNLQLELFNSFSNINIFLKRRIENKFVNEGRIHNLSESIKKDNEIYSLLLANNIEFIVVEVGDINQMSLQVLNYVMEKSSKNLS